MFACIIFPLPGLYLLRRLRKRILLHEVSDGPKHSARPCRVPSFHHPPSQPTLQVLLPSSCADGALLAGRAVAVLSLLLTGMPLAAFCLWEVGIFFFHELSFNGRKILDIRGRLVEMEEHVRPLKLQKQNRDCRQSKPVLSPPANPP